MTGEITVRHMPTEQMLADVLTKALQAGIFQRLSRELLNWVRDVIRSGGRVGANQISDDGFVIEFHPLEK